MSTTTRAGMDGPGAVREDWGQGVDRWSSPTPAVRGGSQGSVGWTRATDGRALATFLGWFSVGLGLAEILAPREVARFAGIRPSRRVTALARVAGLREIASGMGILANPESKQWVAARVPGDMMDLALLGTALLTASERPDRTALATVAVLGVTALDILCAEELSESRKAPTPETMEEKGTHVHKSITIQRPVSEVYGFWREIENLPRFMTHLEAVEDLGGGRSRWRAEGPAGTSAEWEAETTDDRTNELIAWRSVGGSDLYNAGVVRFREAAGGRGTIVTVEMQYAPPGGKIGAAMMKLLRGEPGQQVADDLRRFKQVMETGEVLLSSATAVPGAHPARPPEPSELR